VSADGQPWQIAWCAGAGVTATPQHVFDDENATFRQFCATVIESGFAANGAFYFASSAGGVYAGSSDPPFTEFTEPTPLAPYGHAKLALEELVHGLAANGVRVAIGRIANLYGPGQNLRKPQGLVSQLCLAIQTRRPLGVYVSLDTLRDYIYVDDAAGLIVDLLQTVAAKEPGTSVTKIIASHESVSIAELLGEIRLMTKRRPPVVLAASPYAKAQARDLRVRSLVLRNLDHRTLTPFPVGVATTLRDVSLRWRGGLTG
jgi:UDP-glucose 4-epimerase